MVEALPAAGLTCREDAAIAQLLALGANKLQEGTAWNQEDFMSQFFNYRYLK